MEPESFEYIKERYHEEVSRFSYIEDKSGKLLSLLSVAIAVFIGMVGFKSKMLLSPNSAFEWAIIVIGFLASAAFASAWGQSLKALKLGECPVPNKSRENANYLIEKDRENSIEHIVECYVNTTELLTPVIEEKAKALSVAYKDLVLSAWFVSMFTILIAGNTIMTKKQSSKTETPKTESSSTTIIRPPPTELVTKSLKTTKETRVKK